MWQLEQASFITTLRWVSLVLFLKISCTVLAWDAFKILEIFIRLLYIIFLNFFYTRRRKLELKSCRVEIQLGYSTLSLPILSQQYYRDNWSRSSVGHGLASVVYVAVRHLISFLLNTIFLIILCFQRTEVEQFFLDSLEYVKNEIVRNRYISFAYVMLEIFAA